MRSASGLCSNKGLCCGGLIEAYRRGRARLPREFIETQHVPLGVATKLELVNAIFVEKNDASVLPVVEPAKATDECDASISYSGFVGFFDILGYQNLLENSGENLAGPAIVLKHIKDNPAKVLEKMSEIAAYAPAQLNAIVSDLKTVVFSDTLLLTLRCDKNLLDTDVYARWIIFTHATALLQRKMFDNGLPIRGAIAFGEYLVDDALFAGRPIVDAYKAGKNVDAAIVCLDKSTEIIHKKHLPEPGNHLVREYLLPRKDGTTVRGFAIDFTKVGDAMDKSLTGDVRKLVATSFAGKGKIITPAVHQKLTNTEMFLRFLLPSY